MARSPATARKRILSEEDHGDLEGLVGYNLKRAYVILSTDFRRALGEDGFAPRVFSALSLIVEFQDDITAVCVTTVTNDNRMIDVPKLNIVALRVTSRENSE